MSLRELRELTIVNFRLLDFHGGGVTKQMMEDATDAVICRCTGEYVEEQNRWWLGVRISYDTILLQTTTIYVHAVKASDCQLSETFAQ